MNVLLCCMGKFGHVQACMRKIFETLVSFTYLTMRIL